MTAHVVAVHSKSVHAFSKDARSSIHLVEGHGVAGDAHSGVTVKHRSRVARDPTQPNLRQVHLLHEELLTELLACGLSVLLGQIGENITTRGVDILAVSTGTRLRIGPSAVVQVTGLRNPCGQIETFMPGLLAAVLGREADGSLVRKAGVMGIVLEGGAVQPGSSIEIISQPDEYQPLEPV